MVIAASLDLHAAAGCLWEVLVIGAGPAGSLAARQLAQRGVRVLLVDRSGFPRWKVCGSCLNIRALATLRRVGLGEPCRRFPPLTSILLATEGRKAPVRLPGGAAVSREAFDAWLVQSAMDAGAAFLPGTNARLGFMDASARRIVLEQDGKRETVAARVVLAANGLGFLTGNSAKPSMVLPNARIGAGVVAEEAPGFYEPGSIYMSCGRGGYVGLVRLEDGRLNVAAALDPQWVKEAGGLGKAAAGLLEEAGLPPVPDLAGHPWRGTPRLTHAVAPPAAQRLFYLGDAAGYVEPFTGEGIGWALESGAAVAPLAYQACRRWDDQLIGQWSRVHRQRITRRWWTCRAAAQVLRRPKLVRTAIALLAAAPGIGTPFVRYLNAKDAS